MRNELIEIDGDWWPKSDTECRPSIMKTYKDADEATALCGKKRVAVQAGGNCGIWPRYLAKKFRTVYTFEPDADNFLCLSLNAQAKNIIKLQAALGNKREPISMLTTPLNAGAHRVLDSGLIPQIRLDDLHLPHCDFLQLDVEGFEYFALRGAEKTIIRCRPVIMYEDKLHHMKYGIEKSQIDRLLATYNYRVYKKVNRDMIMVPSS